MNYSHTKISVFEQCPLKYKYQYLDRVTAKLGKTVEAFMGSRVHDALEKLYRDLKMTRLLSVEELRAFYEKEWEKLWDGSVRIIKQDYTPEEYRQKGWKCVEDYYRSYHPFDQGRTIGIEERVAVELRGDRKLAGFIDRLVVRDDGTHEVHDYKTSNHLPSQEEADGDRQLALYQIGVQNRWPDVEAVELVWHYLVFDREVRSRRTGADLEKLLLEVNRLIDEIESAREFEPRPSSLCDWCEFRDICPVWKHQYATSELPPEEFKEDDGVKLVNRYSALLGEESRIKEEKERLKESLADFSASFGCEVVYGSDHKIKVKKVKRLQFPPSGGKEREVLEGLLKEAGSWGDLSTLSLPKLESALRKGELDPDLREKLKPLYVEEEAVRLTTSKIKVKEK